MLLSAPGDVDFYPCLNRVGGRVFIHSGQGVTIIVEPGRKFNEVGRNALDEGSPGTPTFASTRMFTRCADQLYCIGKKP